MKVVVGLPPIFEEIARVLPGALRYGVLFSWGDTIFNPDNVPISQALMAHEEVHGRQHAAIGGPEIWWSRYMMEPRFRLEQEEPAHIVELGVITQGWRTNRHHRQGWLNIIARRLSGPLYNKLIPMHKAESLLRHAMKEMKV